jgi:hypothetical protein
MSPRKKKTEINEPMYRYIQLVDGTELISIVHDSDDADIVRMEDPLKIMNMTGMLENPSDNSHTIMLSSWLPLTNDIFVSVDRDNVLVVANPTDTLIRHYKKVVAMLIERSINDEIEMMDRNELPDMEEEMTRDELLDDNPLQDLVDTLKKAIDTKKKNITYH